MTLIKCGKCEKEFDIKLLECPHCKSPIFAKEDYTLLTPQEKQILRKLVATTDNKYKTKIILCLFAFIIGIPLMFINILLGMLMSMAGIIYLFVSAEFDIKKYYNVNISNKEKKSTKQAIKNNEKTPKVKKISKKQLIILCLSIVVGIIIMGVIITIIVSQQTDSEYEKMKNCWDKGMDYNNKTGRCMTADEAYNDWITNPNN